MPNRRRRKLSTAMSAVAALAVASPFAVVAIAELTAPPTPQQHEFEQAAVVTDLPNEIISALSQGLSKFGINLPPLPVGLSPAGAQPISAGPTLTTPGLATSPLTATGLTPSPLAAPGLTPSPLAAPGLTPSPLAAPGLTPSLATPGTAPVLAVPNAAAPSALTDTTLTNPALTGTTPALATPPVGASPLLTSPTLPGTTPSLGLPATDPIATPSNLGSVDPIAGTYPILGDPSVGLGVPAAAPAGGGIISDLSSAAQQLGAGQAIDLIKGIVMPGIMTAIQQAAPAAAAAPAAVAAPAIHAAEVAAPLA